MIALLNLDNSYPTADAYHDSNNAGTVRFISAADPRGSKEVIDRVFGDVVHRDKLIQLRINDIINLLNGNPYLSSFDNSPYALLDGSRPFTAPVTVVTPTGPNHATNRSYVDTMGSGFAAQFATFTTSLNDLAGQVPIYHRSAWVEHEWQANAQVYLDLPLTEPITTMDRIMGIQIVEKIDVAQPTPDVPNPDPIWVYRSVNIGGKTNVGFRIDDAWLPDNETVRTVIPNTSGTVVGYPSEADYNLQSPRQRFLRALVWEYRVETPVYNIVTTDYGDSLITLPCAGTLFEDLVFGYWSPNRPVILQGMQLSVQDIADDTVTVEIMVDGEDTGITASIPPSTATVRVAFDAPGLSVAAGAEIRLKVTAVGTDEAGGFLTANLQYTGY